MSNVTNFLTPLMVTEYLKDEIKAVLNKNKIYQMSTLGFYFDEYGDDRINQDFLGIAKWLSDERVKIMKASPYETVVNQRPTDEEKEIMWLGQDIDSSFDNSRLMIGHMLLVKEATTEKSKKHNLNRKKLSVSIDSIDDDLFNGYYISAMVQLSTLSDRIKTYLIACLSANGQDVDKYKNNDKNTYSQIFYDIRKIIGYKRFECLAEDQNRYYINIKAVAKRITKYRKVRNDLVHETSSFDAIKTKEMMDSFQDVNEELKLLRINDDKFPDNNNNQKIFTETKDIDYIKFCIQWYEDLIVLVEFVFRIDGLLREQL